MSYQCKSSPTLSKVTHVRVMLIDEVTHVAYDDRNEVDQSILEARFILGMQGLALGLS